MVEAAAPSVRDALPCDSCAPARRAALQELRLRTVMELHDGILQTLTAAALQIAVARQLVETDPSAADRVLGELLDGVVAEQRELRAYVDEVREGFFERPYGAEPVEYGLEAAAKRVGRDWKTDVRLDVADAGLLPPALYHQILRISQEAIVNAARHGGAGQVSVSLVRDGHAVVLTVADDGSGFPFLGDYDQAALTEQRRGPLSLKQRVAAGGGSMTIRSTREGSTVTVRLPLPEGEGDAP